MASQTQRAEAHGELVGPQIHHLGIAKVVTLPASVFNRISPSFGEMVGAERRVKNTFGYKKDCEQLPAETTSEGQERVFLMDRSAQT